MAGICSLIYMFAFAILSNCYTLVHQDGLLMGSCIVALALLNAMAGLFIVKTDFVRRRFLWHGTVLLLAFCLSVTVSVTMNILYITDIMEASNSVLIGNIIYCVVSNFIMFWNGIISVYLTSAQLGIKTRVIGLLCGFIPIANLFALGNIIYKTYNEVIFESKKEKLNDERKEDQVCKTRYPILFIHGVFFRDYKHLNYWGRIPRELMINGATCYYGNHESALSVEKSGEALAYRIEEIIKESGCKKVNIIAHSKGGLDCRYALDHCDVSKCVASLTTINTPHRGCQFADWLLNKTTKEFKENIANTYNKTAKLLGDEKPDFLAAVTDLTAEVCLDFDKNIVEPTNVYCQSVGSVMKKATSGKFPLNLSHNFVRMFDGQNDGLVGVESFQWGNKYTLVTNTFDRGISHGDMIDLNRENIKGFDVREFYVQLVSDLKKRGL